MSTIIDVGILSRNYFPYNGPFNLFISLEYLYRPFRNFATAIFVHLGCSVRNLLLFPLRHSFTNLVHPSWNNLPTYRYCLSLFMRSPGAVLHLTIRNYLRVTTPFDMSCTSVA